MSRGIVYLVGAGPGRPLSGRRILVARARPGTSQIAKELRGLGADVTEAPDVQVAPPSEPARLAAALARLPAYGAVLFACEPGVERTLEVARAHAELSSALGTASIVAIGAGAASALRRAGLEPRVKTDGACVDELARHAPRLRLAPSLLVASEEGRPSLVADLSTIGVAVETVAAYRLVRRFDDATPARFDLVVLPSSSAAQAVLSGPWAAALRDVPMIAMGPKTGEAARACGATAISQSRRDTVPSMLGAVLAGSAQ